MDNTVTTYVTDYSVYTTVNSVYANNTADVPLFGRAREPGLIAHDVPSALVSSGLPRLGDGSRPILGNPATKKWGSPAQNGLTTPDSLARRLLEKGVETFKHLQQSRSTDTQNLRCLGAVTLTFFQDSEHFLLLERLNLVREIPRTG